jgi:alcohol dehydrogenase (cytochrome c)
MTQARRSKAGIFTAALLGTAAVALGGGALVAAPSASQLEMGRKVYAENCAVCHGASYAGAFGPPVSGDAFVAKWTTRGPEALAEHIRTMPPASPGTLSDEAYDALNALLRDVNKMPAVEAGAPSARAVPEAAPLTPSGAPHGGMVTTATADPVADAYQAGLQALVDKLTPVTDEMLAKPEAGEWLSWRRTRDALGFSPLDQINKGNAASLTLAWALPLGTGTNAITPLVHDGVMFVDSGNIQALDAKTGDQIWRVERKSKPVRLPFSQARGIAIYGDAIYTPTTDNHVIALDMRTGKLRWDVGLAPSEQDKLQLTAAPLAVKGKIIQGMSGCQGQDYKGGCFVVALDAATGKEAWRFHTIARPGQPGGDSWNGAPVEERFGGSVWTGASYDPELDLLYVGTAQTYKIGTLLKPNARKGASGDALFTNSTLALEPDTGKLAWHYQHFPGDVWDLDWAFEQSVLPLNGRKTVLTVGKLGIIDALDAKTGRYLWSKDLGLQNLVTSIDPKTGQKIWDQGLRPELDKPKIVCPGALGTRNWPATAIDPVSGRLFVPMNESCMRITLLDSANTPVGDMRLELIKRPDTDGNLGRLSAVDLGGREITWSRRSRMTPASAMLATAGGVLFEGSLDRRFRALDSATGEVLWETRLDDSPYSFPITYAVDGVQYVAVVTGGGMPFDLGFRAFTPETQGITRQRTLYVFKLGTAAAK